MDQERRSQREMMQENEKQARTTYTRKRDIDSDGGTLNEESCDKRYQKAGLFLQ